MSIQLGRIIPTDELIFFRGVGIPPTSYIREKESIDFPMKIVRLSVFFFKKNMKVSNGDIVGFDGISWELQGMQWEWNGDF